MRWRIIGCTVADAEFFDYAQPFVHRWKDKFLHSVVKEVTPGQVCVLLLLCLVVRINARQASGERIVHRRPVPIPKRCCCDVVCLNPPVVRFPACAVLPRVLVSSACARGAHVDLPVISVRTLMDTSSPPTATVLR